MRKISELSLINAYVALFAIAIGITVAAKLDTSLTEPKLPSVKFESLSFTRPVGQCNINIISGVTEYVEERNGGPVVTVSELRTLNKPESISSSSSDKIVLNSVNGTVDGPSGKETYYNLKMSGVVKLLYSLGIEDHYWVRDDGVKMYGDYVMVATDTYRIPKGTILETTLGAAMVCDHCESAESYSGTWIDVAVNW